MAGFFTEVQDTGGVGGLARLSENAGTAVDMAALASGVHAGALRLEITYVAGPPAAVRSLAAWASEPYTLQSGVTSYSGMVSFRLAENSVAMSVRYIGVITSP